MVYAVLDDLCLYSLELSLFKLVVSVPELQENPVEPTHSKLHERKSKTCFFLFFLSLLIQDLGIDKDSEVFRIAELATCTHSHFLTVGKQLVHDKHPIVALDLVGSEIGHLVLRCDEFKLVHFLEDFFILGKAGDRDLEGKAVIERGAKDVGEGKRR